MSQITSPATYSISRPQDVIDIVNKNSAINTSIGVIFIALGGILIDAYQAAMVGFGNKYIAAQFGISPGLAATVNASVLIAALIGGLLANRVINRFGQKRAFIIGMGLCTIGAAAVAIAPSIWWVLVCRVIMGFGLGIDFPLATNAVAELWFNVEENRNVGQPLANGLVCFDNRCLFGAFAAASVWYR